MCIKSLWLPLTFLFTVLLACVSCIFLCKKDHYVLVSNPWHGTIGHVNNIPTMQSFTGIFRKTQSKSYMLSLTEGVWEFQNNAFWDYSLTCPIRGVTSHCLDCLEWIDKYKATSFITFVGVEADILYLFKFCAVFSSYRWRLWKMKMIIAVPDG